MSLKLFNQFGVQSLSAASSFIPTDISGLTAWFDADDSGTIIESGNSISQWNDKSGNGNNVTQATSSNQPLTNTNTINGKNVITFDGLNDYLKRATWTGGVIAQPNTAFVVFKFDINAARTIFDGSSSGTERHIIRTASSSTISIWAGAVTVLTSSDVGSLAVPRLITAVYNSTSSEIYMEGTLEKTGDSGSFSMQGISLGSNWDVALPFDGDIAEVIIYNKLLNTTERQQAEAYLTTKWGI